MSPYIVNFDYDIRILDKLEWYPCFGVKRIGIVLEQRSGGRNSKGRFFDLFFYEEGYMDNLRLISYPLEGYVFKIVEVGVSFFGSFVGELVIAR